MKFVLPDLRVGESVTHWQEDPSKTLQDGSLEDGWGLKFLLSKAPSMGVTSTGASIYQVNVSKLRRPLDTVDSEELPDSRERTGAPVLWLSCEGQIDVLGAVLWQILFKCCSWSTRTLGGSPSWPWNQECWELLTTDIATRLVKAKEKESQDCHGKQKEILWQQYCLSLAVAEYQILGVKHFLILGPESRRIWWLKKGTILQNNTTANGLSRVARNPSGFLKVLAITYIHLSW